MAYISPSPVCTHSRQKTRSVSYTHLNAYGNMPLDVLIRLALVFETSTDYILGLTGNPTPYPRRSRLP